ncbi:MAG TPA: hypothetical protein VE198_21330 [Actinoallomurus sp.]|jgi:hypothetical protein|nr:hypothetical protein [Actinoallomurus sp.]
MVRERLRRLRAGERDFVWTAQIGHVAGEEDCHRCIRLRVWGGGKNSRVMQADLLSKSWGSPWSACAADDAYLRRVRRPPVGIEPPQVDVQLPVSEAGGDLVRPVEREAGLADAGHAVDHDGRGGRGGAQDVEVVATADEVRQTGRQLGGPHQRDRLPARLCGT